MVSLGVRGIPPPQCNDSPVNPLSQSFLSLKKSYQTHLSFSNPVTQLRFCAILRQIRLGSCVFSIKSPRKGGSSLLEMEDFEDEYNDEEDDDYDEEEDDEDEEIVVPLKNMKKWLENKPSGFGEGKMYDTSIEDKLAEEMEQSRLAQLENIKKLKNNPGNTNSKKEQLQKEKVSEAVLGGVRVRLVNLPKKKNIHRDLQQAFKGVKGIVNIVPVVSGNKKTREPICKGIAFVDFKSEDEAQRFVHIFSRQSIAFGRIQKQIKYEMMNSTSRKLTCEKSVDINYPPHEPETILENHEDDSEMDNSTINSRGETFSDEYDTADGEHLSAKLENEGQILEESNILELSDNDNRESKGESATSLLSSKQEKKTRAKRKKLVVKRKGKNVQKLNIPGSANRLKIKEKAVLTDVFSKYGGPAADLTVKEHR